MHTFTKNDKVKVWYEEQWCRGIIEKVGKKSAQVWLDEVFDTVRFSLSKLSYLLPIRVTGADFRRLARFEIPLRQVLGEDGFCDCIENTDAYQITVADVLEALKNVKASGITKKAFYDEWFCYFDDVLADSVDGSEKEQGVYTAADALRHIGAALNRWLYQETETDVDELIDTLQAFIEDEQKPPLARRYPLAVKEELLERLESDYALEHASEEEVALYRQFANELCAMERVRGLLAVGYGCYGGNRAFACDWETSRDCMQKLLSADVPELDKAFYANTLGYIYYYGRCNNGVPQYEEAYRYFSFAAFNGIYEAEYKVADMYQNGYGVPKSRATAEAMICRLYDKNLSCLLNGEFNCKFADIALRMGNLCKDEEQIENSDFTHMLYYYLQADFAIRMRMAEVDYYGDSKVCAAIQNALAETKTLMGFRQKKKVCYDELDSVFSFVFSNGRQLEMTVKARKNNRYTLTFRIHKKQDESTAPRMFITIPELALCGMFDKFSITAITQKPLKTDGIQQPILIDDICYDFYFNGGEVFEGSACEFEIKAPAEKAEKAYRLAAVCFRPSGRTFDYFCEDTSIQEGDTVVIPANSGEIEAEVVRIITKRASELALPVARYEKILRKL